MAKFTLAEILDAVGGKLKQFPGKSGVSDISELELTGISTDTRTIEEGNLFIALIGESFDGNKYAVAAVNDGAAALVLSTMEHAPEDVPVILVPDTKIALEKIAEYYRKRLACKVVAVTGSVGKTSTREMIASALSRGLKVHATKNNNNNEIGLSQTILAAPEDTDVIVLEMGMRLRGEISELTNIAHPDVAVITNIGVAHIERLGSREEILKAKLEILEGLSEGGLLILPYADEYLKKAVAEGMIREDVRIAYTFTEKTQLEKRPYGMAVAESIDIKGDRICCHAKAGFDEMVSVILKLSAVGIHHVGNALAGLLCGLYLGISPDRIEEGIASFVQIGHRERLVKVDHVFFLDDSYNAGPESMMSAFASIRRLAGDKKAYACIGDMLELGPVSSEKHFEIGAKAAELHLNGLLVIGDFKEDVRAGANSVDPDIPVFGFEDKDHMTEKLAEIVEDGDYVLLKASHAFEMYTILESYGSIVREGKEP